MRRTRSSMWMVAAVVLLVVLGAERHPLYGKPADGVPDRFFWPPLVERQQTTPHPAVVRVVAQEQGAFSNGSGTLVSVRGQHGLVVTNWHVVRDAAGEVNVVFPDGFRSAARVLQVDPDWDLAALLIWRPKADPVLIATTPPRPGDILTIAGYGQDRYRAVSGRCTQYVAPGVNFPYEMVELSVQARQGDSGGPILNDRGELAGVLFGASRGTTSGSYCGRVRQFLAPLWPEADNREAVVTAPTTPSALSALDAAAPIGNVAENESIGGESREFESREAVDAFRPVAVPHTRSTSEPIDWQDLAGRTPFEKTKTVLAGIGLLAVLLQVTKWLSDGKKSSG